jgi:hypothetical protein
LVKPLLPTIFRGIIISIGIVAAMFFFTYLPQVAVLAFISGPLGKRMISFFFGMELNNTAFIAAVPLVLGEAYFLIMFFTRGFLLGNAGLDLFDAVS